MPAPIPPIALPSWSMSPRLDSPVSSSTGRSVRIRGCAASGISDMPSRRRRPGAAPAASRIVGARSALTVSARTTRPRRTPGPRIISGTRTDGS